MCFVAEAYHRMTHSSEGGVSFQGARASSLVRMFRKKKTPASSRWKHTRTHTTQRSAARHRRHAEYKSPISTLTWAASWRAAGADVAGVLGGAWSTVAHPMTVQPICWPISRARPISALAQLAGCWVASSVRQTTAQLNRTVLLVWAGLGQSYL